MKLFADNMKTKENKPKKRLSLKTVAMNIVCFVLGAVLFAVSVDVFTAPNDIAPGGVTGIATMIGNATGLPIGAMTLAINVPIFLLAWIFINFEYAFKSCIGLVFTSIAVDVLAPYLPEYTGNVMLASLFGGIIMGIALGLIFMRGSSTGGSDIIARIVHKFLPHITQGNLILFIDAAVVAAACLVYDLEVGLYSIITVFVCSYAIDRVLYGSDTGKLLYIMTGEVEKVNAAINEQLERGTTLLSAKGGYSGEERDVIMCAVRQREAYKVRRMVREIDPDAFIVVSDASEILGEGFRPIEQNEFGESEN